MYHHGYVGTFGVAEFIDLEMAGFLLVLLIAAGLATFALVVELFKLPLKKYHTRLGCKKGR